MGRLDGHRPLLTRSIEDAAAWTDALAAEGADPIVLPCIDTEVFGGERLGNELAAAIARTDWLVFTSRRGVDAVASLLGASRQLPQDIRCAAVGRSTAEHIEAVLGLSVVHVGSSTGAALARELAARSDVSGSRFVLALAENAGDALESALREAGAWVERFDVYRTLPAPPREPKLRVSALGATAVVFASPTAVTGFDNQVDIDKALQIVTIGPSTSAAVRARRWPVTAEAREPGVAGIIESMAEMTHAC